MRLTAAEKREVIRLVEGSDLSVRQTLQELGVNRAQPSTRGIAATGPTATRDSRPSRRRRGGTGIAFPRRCASAWSTSLWQIRNARRGSWRGSSPIAPAISSRNPASTAS